MIIVVADDSILQVIQTSSILNRKKKKGKVLQHFKQILNCMANVTGNQSIYNMQANFVTENRPDQSERKITNDKFTHLLIFPSRLINKYFHY